jgi:hypothetical protein
MNTITNLSRYGIKILFMRFMKIAGAFVNPKGTTKYSWCPYLDTKVVFGTSSFLILIW